MKQITNFATAIRLYYGRVELSNADIRELFGEISSATIAKLKKKARAQMTADNCYVWNANCVNTQAAYTAWQIDINDIEKRYAKLKKLGFI